MKPAEVAPFAIDHAGPVAAGRFEQRMTELAQRAR
jgi:hypothetical protein